LTSLPPKLLDHCPKIKGLKLSNNRLTFLPSEILIHCPKLEWLYLSDNYFLYIPLLPDIIDDQCDIGKLKKEVEARQVQNRKFRYVRSEIEDMPAEPSNYPKPVFRKWIGGINYINLLRDLEEITARPD